MNIKLFLLPNILSILRIILTLPVVFLIVRQQYYLALTIFCIASLTDALDGWVARKFSMQTYFGMVIDPIADKVLLIFTFLSLLFLEIMPLWLFLVIFIRDLMIVSAALGYFIGRDSNDSNKLIPSWLGKLNTFLQITLVLFLLYSQVNPSFALWIDQTFIIITTLAFVSWLDYAWLWFKKFILKKK